MNNQNKPAEDDKFGKWHGIDRDTIDWHPVVDESKCVGCGICATTCGRGVYKYDYEKRKSKVVNPTNCMVACQTCANLCPMKAINFTDKDQSTREKAQSIVREHGVSDRAQKELEERKETLDIRGSLI